MADGTWPSRASSLVLALGCALDLHEAAVAGADDVHVGLGLDVFLVGEVEREHATDDADAARGDRAGERLGPRTRRCPARSKRWLLMHRQR
jgi:hypothetical protein